MGSSRKTPATLPIYKWMQKRADAKIAFTVLEKCESEAEVKDAEIYWIAFYRDMGMADLNVTNGGETANGYKHTEEFKELQRERLAERNRLNWQDSVYRERMKSVTHNAGKSNLGKKKKNPLAYSQKLNPDSVREIRALLSAGELSLAAIALRYGIAANSIWAIKHGKSWAWLE